MAHGILNFSASNPCPICGKPDWCGSVPFSDFPGKYFVACKRTFECNNILGKNGKVYAYIGRSKDTGCCYEEMEQHRQRMLEKSGGWSYKEVSASNPCPICGAGHGCERMHHIDGTVFHLCQTNMDGKNVKKNGKLFIFCKFLSNGKYARYEESEARKNRIAAYKDPSRKQEKKEEFKSWKDVEREQTPTPVEEKVPVKDNAYLDKIYRYLLSCLVLDNDHRDYLFSEGWDQKMIDKYQIRSFPESDFLRFRFKNHKSSNPYRKALAKKICEKFGKDCLLGVPGAYRDSKGEWTFYGRKGILFPCYDADGFLYRLRIRMDFTDVREKLIPAECGDPFYEKDGQKYFVQKMKGIYTKQDGQKIFEKGNGKYRNFSSYLEDEEKKKNGIIVNSLTDGCSANNNIGIYYDKSQSDFFICFLTEGEKKAIFAHEKMKFDCITISFPGVNCWSKLFEGEPGKRPVDALKRRGVGIFVVAYDADKAYNEAVLKNEQQTVKALKDSGFFVGTAEWDKVFGKGLDDLLAAGFQPIFCIA